jgi:hypothetical protein
MEGGAFYQGGIEAVNRGNNSQAAQLFERAVELEPDYESANRALTRLQTVLEASGENPEGWVIEAAKFPRLITHDSVSHESGRGARLIEPRPGRIRCGSLRFCADRTLAVQIQHNLTKQLVGLPVFEVIILMLMFPVLSGEPSPQERILERFSFTFWASVGHFASSQNV